MHEVFPVAAGAIIGLATYRFVPAHLRIAVLAVLSVIAGFTASAISGEMELSWGFVPIDILQVVIVAVLTYAASAMWARRTSRI